MLNLSYIFEDAKPAIVEHSTRLRIAPLAATVYMMQVDVLNHYRYALTHYFTLTLNEPYLQGSSLGTPYQKWAHFVNKNFEMLSFAVFNLLRYTGRLVEETQRPRADDPVERTASFKSASIAYVHPLCDAKLKHSFIGIRVHDDQRLSIAPIRTKRDAAAPEMIDIRDRSQLAVLQSRGMQEIATLSELNCAFGKSCNTYYASRIVAEPFDELHEEYLT